MALGAKGCGRSRGGGDSASGAEGCGIALRAMNLYAARGGSKTIQPLFRAMEERHPLWWLAPPTFPLFEGALWVLSNVLHVSKGKRREAYSAPLHRRSPA